jgi:hypothetical protein
MMKTTGILVFKMWSFHDKEWMDGAVKLDHQLESIMLKFEDEARFLVDLHQQAQKRNEDYKLEQQRQQELIDRKMKNIENFKMMLEKSKRWNDAVVLRNYIQEVEKQAIETNALTAEKQEWLAWARSKADWYDPFVEKKDELLDTYNPSILESIRNVVATPSWLYS